MYMITYINLSHSGYTFIQGDTLKGLERLLWAGMHLLFLHDHALARFPWGRRRGGKKRKITPTSPQGGGGRGQKKTPPHSPPRGEGEELHANSTRTSGLPDSPSQLAEARWAGRLSTLFTGILHGMTGSGNLLGVLPALTMPGWLGASMYLTCFGLGTLAAMSVFTALIGEVSCQFSARFDDPSTPAKLAMVSSIFAP